MSPSFKVVLLGDSSVGKTSLLNRLITDKFDPNSPNTIGAAFISKEYTSNDRTVRLDIWDTAGQERYKSLTPMYYRNAKEALVCFDLSCPEASFERARYWVDQIKTSGPPDIKVRVVGNKKDLVDESEVNLSMVHEFCEENEVSLYLTSAKMGEGVKEIFDDMVGSIDREFFETSSEQSESLPQPISLLSRGTKNTTCC